MFSIVVMVIYLCGSLWLLTSSRRSASPRRAHGQLLTGLAMAALGLVFHGALLGHAIFRGPELALSTTDAASLVGWIVALLTLLTLWSRPRFAALGALLLLCVGIAAAFTNDSARDYATIDSGWALTAHIVVAITAYSLIAVGAVFALALSSLDKRLRSHRPLGALNNMPSVEALETAMFQTISAGFALLTLTLFSGLVFVRDLVAQHLAHKVALSFLAWLILGVLLIGRWRFGWRGRIASRWAVGGFCLLGLAYFGSKLILEVFLGRHWG